jgi:hypothetical protein
MAGGVCAPPAPGGGGGYVALNVGGGGSYTPVAGVLVNGGCLSDSNDDAWLPVRVWSPSGPYAYGPVPGMGCAFPIRDSLESNRSISTASIIGPPRRGPSRIYWSRMLLKYSRRPGSSTFGVPAGVPPSKIADEVIDPVSHSSSSRRYASRESAMSDCCNVCLRTRENYENAERKKTHSGDSLDIETSKRQTFSLVVLKVCPLDLTRIHPTQKMNRLLVDHDAEQGLRHARVSKALLEPALASV